MDQGFAVMGFGVRRVVVMRGIALMAVLVVAVVVLAVVVLVVGVVAIGVCGLDRRVRRTRGLNFRRQHSGRDRLMGLVGVIFMIVVLMIMMIGTLVRVLVMVMMRVMCAVMFGMRDGVTAFGVDAVMVVALGRMVVERVAVVFGMFLGMFVIVLLAFDRLGGMGRIGLGMSDDLALDPFAAAAAARTAVALPPPAGAVLALLFGLAMGAFVGFDQRLTVGDRDLVIVGVNFAEGEEAVAVAAIFDEGRLQRRLYARDLGEVDIAAQLFALGGLEIKFFDAIAADHNDPGLFRVGGIDQHLVGHFGTLDGGGRGAWRAQIARPGDATVHLIRG